jgi:hypothetical protein
MIFGGEDRSASGFSPNISRSMGRSQIIDYHYHTDGKSADKHYHIRLGYNSSKLTLALWQENYYGRRSIITEKKSRFSQFTT